MYKSIWNSKRKMFDLRNQPYIVIIKNKKNKKKNLNNYYTIIIE